MDNNRLAEYASDHIGLLLSRDLQYFHLRETQQTLHSDDSGVYVCLVMTYLLVKRLNFGVDLDTRNFVVDSVTARRRMLDIIEKYKNSGKLIRL